jgi:hypothetical protein
VWCSSYVSSVLQITEAKNTRPTHHMARLIFFFLRFGSAKWRKDESTEGRTFLQNALSLSSFSVTCYLFNILFDLIFITHFLLNYVIKLLNFIPTDRVLVLHHSCCNDFYLSCTDVAGRLVLVALERELKCGEAEKLSCTQSF